MKPTRTFVTVQYNSTLRMPGSSIQILSHNSIIVTEIPGGGRGGQGVTMAGGNGGYF